MAYSAGSKRERSPDVSRPNMSKLNLVVCGSDGRLKSSISELILQQRVRRSENVEKRDVELHGRLVSLVELPALNRLSEEEVMRQTLRCVSLCDPGVHVFLFIIPDAPVTDEEKAEMDTIQRIFSSRIKKHLMVLIIQENEISKIGQISPFDFSSTDAKTSLQMFGCQHFILKNNSQVPALLQDVENIVTMNSGNFYTTFMYVQAQVELQRNKHRAEIEELRRAMKHTGLTHSEEEDVGVRIVLLGKTGVGKSATGNTILRREAFTSKLTSRSVTRECQKETSEFSRRKITVIDTPDLFDTGVDHVETRKEIVKCVSMAAPGPHVFLLVIQLGRFTQEEKDAVKMIQDTFGDKSRMYTMVLFTRGDDLRGTTIEEFIEGDDSLQNLIQQYGKRYHVFNNIKADDQKQVSELLDKIYCLVATNGGSCYTNEMFQQVEKNIKEEQERIMKEKKEEEIKKKEEELRDKYEAEVEKMKNENEREQQELQNELRKREDEFKKKEEEIKQESDENLRNKLQKKLEEQQKLFEKQDKMKQKALEEQQYNFIKYLEEKHEKEKQGLQKKTQRETREQAEREYQDKLAKALKVAEMKQKTKVAKVLKDAEAKHKTEVAKALKEAEAKVPYRSKRARDWSNHVPILGGAVGGAVGTIEDIVDWIFS